MSQKILSVPYGNCKIQENFIKTSHTVRSLAGSSSHLLPDMHTNAGVSVRSSSRTSSAEPSTEGKKHLHHSHVSYLDLRNKVLGVFSVYTQTQRIVGLKITSCSPGGRFSKIPKSNLGKT